MILESLTDILTAFTNSVFGFLLGMASVFVLVFWTLGKIDPFNEKWRQWEGSIITAIKRAEKKVPSETPHAGATKLNTALDHVLKDYADANGGKKPAKRLRQQLRQGIQTKHAELDRFGELSKPRPRRD
jgi:hypothetical protein